MSVCRLIMGNDKTKTKSLMGVSQQKKKSLMGKKIVYGWLGSIYELKICKKKGKGMSRA